MMMMVTTITMMVLLLLMLVTMLLSIMVVAMIFQSNRVEIQTFYLTMLIVSIIGDILEAAIRALSS